jgi:hypothetical protein
MPLDLPLRLHQRGREALVVPTSLAIVGTSDIYTYEQRTRSASATLRIPGSLLRDKVLGIDDWTARSFSAHRAPVAMFLDFARSFCRHGATLDEEAGETMARHLIDLLVLALTTSSEIGDGQETAVREAHRQRALRVVDARIADFDLSPSRVAELVGVSERHLQSLDIRSASPIQHISIVFSARKPARHPQPTVTKIPGLKRPTRINRRQTARRLSLCAAGARKRNSFGCLVVTSRMAQLISPFCGCRQIDSERFVFLFASEQNSIDLLGGTSSHPAFDDVLADPLDITVERVAIASAAVIDSDDVLTGRNLEHCDVRHLLPPPVGMNFVRPRRCAIMTSAHAARWIVLSIGGHHNRHGQTFGPIHHLAPWRPA